LGILPHLKVSELAWRWAELPTDVQLQIQPLNQTEALLADVRSREFFDGSGPRPPLLQAGARSMEDPHTVAMWLCAQEEYEERVTASWGARTAIVLPWALFCEHWATFCYPGSDDLIVWPASERWALCYRHFGRFEIARRAV
jgi:hypothetical protein